MEGGDTGGYSHGVLKSMTNNECHSSFGFIFVCGQSFLNVGIRFHMWVVVAWWWWRSAMAGVSIWLPHHCQQRGTWLLCQQRKWGEGWVDVPRHRCCVASIWPALVHLVMWCGHVVLVVLGHSVVGWSMRVCCLGLLVLVARGCRDCNQGTRVKFFVNGLKAEPTSQHNQAHI